VKENLIQTLGFTVTFIYFAAILFLYAASPRSIAEVPSKAATTIGNAVSTGQVLTGTYEINKDEFARGLQSFNSDNFVAARDSFERADPRRQDANTQYYIAYSYYRQGWGRVSNDDALFRLALESLDRVTTLDPAFRSTDPNLKLKTPAELKNELEEGLKVTADDFNPLRLIRERY
jgi:hypothetical protein